MGSRHGMRREDHQICFHQRDRGLLVAIVESDPRCPAGRIAFKAMLGIIRAHGFAGGVFSRTTVNSQEENTFGSVSSTITTETPDEKDETSKPDDWSDQFSETWRLAAILSRCDNVHSNFALLGPGFDQLMDLVLSSYYRVTRQLSMSRAGQGSTLRFGSCYRIVLH
ncbi:hypothetical protein BSKO_06746 [Bryopsis sp. KO-2023]|nr:hypothetical protein BSKO_06746 [Bryopsis sp. KO-2023]